jgi:hypothetical protein
MDILGIFCRTLPSAAARRCPGSSEQVLATSNNDQVKLLAASNNGPVKSACHIKGWRLTRHTMVFEWWTALRALLTCRNTRWFTARWATCRALHYMSQPPLPTTAHESKAPLFGSGARAASFTGRHDTNLSVTGPRWLRVIGAGE